MADRGSRTPEKPVTDEALRGEVEALGDAPAGGRPYLDEREQIQALRRRLSALEAENRRLEQALERLRGERLRTPDDLAAAVSHSLDSLQANLSETRNPVSQFAVRELSIEATVHMSVSPLGTLEYRFLDLGEEVPPETLSKIHMTMVPLPKEGAAATDREEPDAGLDVLPGLDADVRRTLWDHQIYTLADLLRVGTRVRSRVALEAMTGVDRERLGQWLHRAELMSIPGVDGRAAAILGEVGVQSLADLARVPPESLIERYNARLGGTDPASAPRLELETARRWVDTATEAVRHRRDS